MTQKIEQSQRQDRVATWRVIERALLVISRAELSGIREE